VDYKNKLNYMTNPCGPSDEIVKLWINKNMKSKCCNASIKDKLTIVSRIKEGETDFDGKTNYYICDECGKPCDIKLE
jgi:hypothetical protein